ncbi:MAG: hypothetical protein Fur0010_14900 [Bdellovibrio sp.]
MELQGIIRNKISLLPEHLIDQIKAGEVVERPASIIKELVENSIDAKSTRIEISIIDNGLTLIRIKDNGIGMRSVDLPMAFCRHATSKINSFEDLYHLISFGFRGEALASVAAVSRVECESIPIEDPYDGGKLLIEGGIEISHIPLKGNESGTTITVRDLFYNTPARLKFVKSQGSEKNALVKMIDSFLISNPQITFSIQWDQEDRQLYKAVQTSDLKKRVWEVIGRKTQKIDDLIYFEKKHLGHKVSGFVSLYANKSNASRSQYLFANQRTFQDRSFHHAISNAMEKIWGRDGGSYVLFIEVPPEEIDVNVHPNKTHVKFSQASMLYSLVIAAIKEALPEIQSDESGERKISINYKNEDSGEAPKYHIPLNLPSPFADATQGRGRYFHRLNEKVCVLENKKGDLFFFEHAEAFSEWMLKKVFSTSTQLSDDEIIPLLIATRFNAKLDPIARERASNFGFIIENLEQDFQVLKGIPETLAFMKNKELMIALLLEFLENQTLGSFSLEHDEIIGFFDMIDESNRFIISIDENLFRSLKK